MPPVNDPIGDLLTRIRNAQSVGRLQCRAPWSRIKQNLCALLVKEGFLGRVEVEGIVPKQELVVTFKADRASLTLERISKPGRRIYRAVDELLPVLRGYGIAILSTSNGLLTDREARMKKVGGELLCTIS
ncbi:MAG: 30S ribosomal protein S8 [Candidatus Peregrinibacteria bacterium]